MLPNKMKNKTCDTVGTVLKYKRKIVERGKIDTLTFKYMIAHFPGFIVFDLTWLTAHNVRMLTITPPMMQLYTEFIFFEAL
jgi:hypothetical protein